MRPMRLDPVSVNQIVPCGPVVMPCGNVPSPTGNSVISAPRNVAGAPISIGEFMLSVSRGGTLVIGTPTPFVTEPILFERTQESVYTSPDVLVGLSSS